MSNWQVNRSQFRQRRGILIRRNPFRFEYNKPAVEINGHPEPRPRVKSSGAPAVPGAGESSQAMMNSLSITHLKELESESIYVIREVAAQFERPALLFSGGKDSIVLSHLARKAFWPARIPFPLLHIDTGHNFEETITYRDQWVAQLGAKLIVRYMQDSIDKGRVKEEK